MKMRSVRHLLKPLEIKEQISTLPTFIVTEVASTTRKHQTKAPNKAAGNVKTECPLYCSHPGQKK